MVLLKHYRIRSLKLSTEEIQVNIIHKGVGAITETDVYVGFCFRCNYYWI